MPTISYALAAEHARHTPLLPSQVHGTTTANAPPSRPLAPWPAGRVTSGTSTSAPPTGSGGASGGASGGGSEREERRRPVELLPGLDGRELSVVTTTAGFER